MTYPTIHPNGTCAWQLSKDYTAALEAVRMASEVLRQTAPNARDYYTQGVDAFSQAEAEHRARLGKLGQVLNDLEGLIHHCGKARYSAKGPTP